MNTIDYTVPANKLEREVIGYLFMPELMSRIPVVEEELFTGDNKQVVKCMKEVYEKFDEISILSVEERAREKYPSKNGQLTNIVVEAAARVVSPVGYESTYETLREKRKRVDALLTMRSAYTQAKAGETKDSLGKFNDALQALSADEGYYVWGDIDDVLIQCKVERIPSAIKEYRLNTGGYFKKQVHTFASLPGHGKTTHSVNELVYLTLNGYKVAYFSLEMSNPELMQKILSIGGDIPNKVIQYGGTIPHENLTEAARTIEIMREKAYIYDNINDINPMIASCKAIDPDVVIIDFLQYMKLDHYESYRIGILDILKKLKEYVKKDNKVGIVYSQMSREAEKRRARMKANGMAVEDNIDTYMSDAAESNAIEIVSGYLTFMTWKWLVTGKPQHRHDFIMDIRKARLGGGGRINMKFEPDKCIMSPVGKDEVPF